jgi:general secretion pathway protein D
VQEETPVASGISSALGGGALPLGGLATANVDKLKTGIQIELTPHVNAASRTIRLEIKQQVDDINDANVPKTLQDYQHGTTSRLTDTTIVVKDRDLIMMGGLLKDTENDVTSKIPLLGDIPILGWLFKSSKHKVQKTNLIILLHPRIIGTTVSAAQVAKDSLDKREDFLQHTRDPEDTFKDEVSAYRNRLNEQIERGSKEKVFDYRNNNDDADDDKVPPGQESDLEKASKEPTPEKTSANEFSPGGTAVASPPTPAPATPPSGENAPLIVPPPVDIPADDGPPIGGR